VLWAGLVVGHRFVRWYPGRNQRHSIEFQLKVRLLGADEVTKMWRIEGPAENPDPHWSISVPARSRPDVARALDEVLERA